MSILLQSILSFILFTSLIPLGLQAKQPGYTDLPTQNERTENKDYFRFPYSLPIIEDGNIIEERAQYVDWSKLKSKNIIKEELLWLVLREFDLETSQIYQTPQGGLRVPFLISLRHQLKGKRGAVIQGTLNIKGEIELVIENKQVVDVIVTHFDDSQLSEAIGRKFELIDQYDLEFAQFVVIPVVSAHLKEDAALEMLVAKCSSYVDEHLQQKSEHETTLDEMELQKTGNLH